MAEKYISRTKIDKLPIRYYDQGFGNFHVGTNTKKSKIKDVCWKFATEKPDGQCLVLSGTVGVGKTHLAVAIAKNIHPRQTSSGGMQKSFVRFMVADEMFAKFNDIASGGKSKLSYIEDILRSDLIVIDDLGVSNFSPAKQENLYLLINSIYLRRRRLVLTTNFTMEQLTDVDERIPSRLAEMGKIILFTAKDYRIGAGLQNGVRSKA